MLHFVELSYNLPVSAFTFQTEFFVEIKDDLPVS